MLTFTIMAMAAAAAQAAAEIPMRAEDPVRLHASLREMGLSPDPLDLDKAPTTLISVGGKSYWVILGGCDDKKKACRTVMVGSRFTDVKNAPLAWINRQNEQFDLLKLWNNEQGELGFSVQAPAQGMTRANFRALVDGLLGARDDLAAAAEEAKLVSE